MSMHVNPPEPKGLGAVVEIASGEWLIRYADSDLAPWVAVNLGVNADRPYRYYKDQTVTRVLSEGVAP
jgi:hypothetical protein